MTYNSLQEIENAFAEPANETYENKRKRLHNKQQAIRRFNERQQSLQSQPTTSTATTSATLRKQNSRTALTEEQNESILIQNRISHQIHYATKQEHFRNQFLKVGCCTIDNYVENTINGDEVENGRHKFKEMNIICE